MITVILNLIYGFFLAAGILAAVFGILVIVLKFYKMRFAFHICWFFFGLFMFISFILSGILLAVSTIGFHVCDFLDGFLHDLNEFEGYPDDIGKDVTDKLKNCMKFT